MRNPVSEIEKAYIAGLVDGEASLSIAKCQGERKGIGLQPYVDIANNNLEVLEYVQLLYGGIINTIDTPERRLRHWVPTHHLRFWTPEKVIQILGDIFSYLIIKKEHAKILLSFCESRLQRKGNRTCVTSWRGMMR